MKAGTVKKQNSEILDIAIDFTNNLFEGTVASAVVTARNYTTGATVTGTILSGAPTVASPNVTQRLIAGTAGDIYVIEYKATMSGGQLVEDEVYVVMLAI